MSHLLAQPKNLDEEDLNSLAEYGNDPESGKKSHYVKEDSVCMSLMENITLRYEEEILQKRN